MQRAIKKDKVRIFAARGPIGNRFVSVAATASLLLPAAVTGPSSTGELTWTGKGGGLGRKVGVAAVLRVGGRPGCIRTGLSTVRIRSAHHSPHRIRGEGRTRRIATAPAVAASGTCQAAFSR
jgi:hypothetical protein